MKISLVVAVAKNGVIGKDNDLPWHLPDDMKFFMETTKGHHVILGRKNYDSLPPKYKPLPQRTNVVVTRQKDFSAPGCLVVHSVEHALQIAAENSEKEAMVIGGAAIYTLSMPYAHRLYITEIDAVVNGDVYFPGFDKATWKEVSRTHHPRDARHAYAFDIVVYERINLNTVKSFKK
ncbi:MAG TPA: dihydrofolate reductase [Ohtaekwangia sp.]|nr:dihydrofolate reductase [Ohtaekwangia sp.]